MIEMFKQFPILSLSTIVLIIIMIVMICYMACNMK